MPAKVQTYVEMANQTALSITQGPEAWMQFLRHSARFYKYSFNDQLLIYAQRPEAIACASYEIWNNTMHRYVRRGAKGIALLDPSDNGTRLRYVFDVADTGELLHSRPVEIWRLEDRHHNTVNTALDNVFSPPPMTNLRDRLKIIALESAANYLDGNLKDIVDSVAGSSLSSYDEAEIGRSFLNTAMFSISFILQARCGMEPDVTQDSLQEIAGWNTPGAVSQLGDAVAEMSKQILRQIEIAVKDYERGVEYDAAELRTERRLPDSGDGPDRAGAEAPGQVRDDAPEVSGGEPSRPVYETNPERNADGAPAGDRRDGADETGDDHGQPEEDERSDRGSEGEGSDDLGGPDERSEDSGGRDDLLGTDLRLNIHAEQLSLFPSEKEQIKKLDAMIIHRPIGTERSDRPVLHLSDEEIEHVLRRGSGFEGGKLRIAALYSMNPTPVDARVFLSNEYGVGGHSHTFLDGTSGFIDYNSRGMQFRRWKTNEEYNLRWHAVERYIRNMMEQGTYLTPQEQQRFAELQSDFLGMEMPLPQPRMHYPPVEPETLTHGYRSTNGIVTQMDIERTLREWNGHIEGKHAMVRFVKEGHTTEEIAERLHAEYDAELPALPVTVNDIRHDVPWTDAANTLNRLVWENEFYTETEIDHLDDIDPVAIREQLAENGIVDGDVVDPEALKSSEIVQQADTDAEALAEQAETDDIPPLRPGERRIPEHDGIPAMREIVVDLTPREPELPVFSYELHAGDTIYLGDQPFVVENVGLFDISMRDPSQTYPILRTESKEMLQRLLGLDIRNDVYRPGFWPEAQETLPEAQPELPVSTENFHITDDHLGEGGQRTKYAFNVAAIRTLKTIEAENRGATSEEQEILSRYVGWGGIPQAFDPENEGWSNEFSELKELLTPNEYDMARSSTLNAHYTSPTVIRAMYQALEQMGFRTGNILEPSCGVGNFFGMLPESMTNSHLYGVELDSVTGRIARLLYPKADITVAGFETTDRKDFFDVAIGNVPFGAYKVSDKAYDRYNFLIHDYFFAKAIDQVRPGGVIAFITSKGTMDKQNPDVRRYIAQRAELLGAIRLPNTAFSANANTSVTSDIIFLQKRDRVIDIEPDWVHLGKTRDGIAVNSYFVDHPDMVLGRMVLDESMYGSPETACVPFENANLADQLSDAVRSIIGEYQEAELPDIGDDAPAQKTIPADPSVKNYSFTVVDGDVYYRQNSVMVQPDLSETARERVKGLVQLRSMVNELIQAQMDNAPDEIIEAHQQRLNAVYDAFTARYGLINARGNANVFSSDSSYYLLCSLEIVNEKGELVRKADMFSKRTIRHSTPVTHVDTPAEALAVSITERARVDLPFMAELTGMQEEDIADQLTGVIFQVPGPLDNDGRPTYVTADEYLSGNVRQKLREAEDAAEMSPYFDVNVQALKAAQPKDLEASEIDVRLGATWVDKKYINDFMWETFQTPFYMKRTVHVNFSAYTAEWYIDGKNMFSANNVAAYVTYGTDRANAYRILEDTLNLRDIRIYDTIQDAEGKEKRVLNQKETTLAQQKQQAIKEAFRDWVWRDPDRREDLVHTYNELFNSIRPREFDGSHISFDGMTPEIDLREHQRNAVAHILYGGNTLLAHEVGAGKTFEMVAAVMESKRLGLCQKAMFVVPNHLTEQWASEFLRLYPSANILVANRKDFEKANRQKFCARIATGDYDAVILGHSQFERIPVSQERQQRLLKEQIDDITDGIMEMKRNRGERYSIKQLERAKRSLEVRLKKLEAEEKKDDVVTFEQLGVDRLYVDEAHAFKNLFLFTKMRNVAGLSASEAQKSSDMFLKCRYMDEVTGGRGIVFATGTPVSNSMTELYTMQRYLQYGTLQQKSLSQFDCWASTFGETTTAIELAPEGTGYRARTRFAKFFNLPELMKLFSEVADIKTADQLNLPRPEAHYETVVVHPSEYQKEMVGQLSERAAAVHSGSVDPSQDNMLKITSDGRKLGLDQRLINPLLPDDPGSKVNACVNNIVRIYNEGNAEKLTQLVFCDLSTPRGKATNEKEAAALADAKEETGIGNFNIYDDIREKLVSHGIPREEVAFIHEANTEKRKSDLFAKVRSGQVRILMGSTQKMGAGTNVQDRLIALHDLDCPWRPGDLEQRAGRIVRQGNQNKEVFIFRYVTEGTFDGYLWQTVENKQKFISQIMSSKSPVRSCEDIDETALSYAEIKALCAGDPRIKEKMDLDVDVARLRLMKSDHLTKQYRLEDQILKKLPQEIDQAEQVIAAFDKDIEVLREHPLPEEDFVGMRVDGSVIGDKEEAGNAILEACKKSTHGEVIPIGEYRGFELSVQYDLFNNRFQMSLQGALTHRTDAGTDARGNILRLDNVLANMPQRQEDAKARLENARNQLASAKEELGKPFPQEEELKTKSARLAVLDAELNLDRTAHPPAKEKSTEEPDR
ncbi:MAG: DEAD/DEAH box helicase family protein [Clostridia bacterium]|nr:DEAD/DEAH box helicase family protein [Clostridia bacterium]